MNRSRVAALAGALAFAVVIATVAVVASRGGSSGRGQGLPKLQFAASAGAGGSDAKAGTDAAAPAIAAVPASYEVKGTLPALAGDAPAYRVVADVTTARVNGLAAALGVPADAVVRTSASPSEPSRTIAQGDRRLIVDETRGDWRLVTSPGTCEISAEGITSCSSTTAVAGTVNAAPSGSVSSGGSAGSTGSPTAGGGQGTTGSVGASPPCPMPPCPAGSACAQVCPPSDGLSVPGPSRPADLPTGADAERIGRAVLTKAGVDLSGADVRVEDQFMTWQVLASPRVGGLPATDLLYGVTVGPKGAVVGAFGLLVRFDKIGDYPLAGTTVGLDRLRAGRFAGPRPLLGVDSQSDLKVGRGPAVQVAPAVPPGEPVPAPDAKPPVPAPDGKQPVPVPDGKQPVPAPATEQKVVITGVHLALARAFRSADRDVLAPVYVFEVEGGFGLPPVPAVVDRLLEPEPQPGPGSEPPTKQLPPGSPATPAGDPGTAPGAPNQSSPAAPPSTP